MASIAGLGEVKPASTRTALRATNNTQAFYGQAPTVAFQCHAIQFQALAANTGVVYICDRQTPTLTLHVLGEVPPPTTSPVIRPIWAVGDPANPANSPQFNAASLWI